MKNTMASRPTKFALIGTSCSGKSTLAYKILYELKMRGFNADGVIQQDRRFSFDKAKLETHFESQCSFIANQIKAEADMALRPGIEILVCDRSPLDLYAYSEWTFGVDSDLYNFVISWCKRTYKKLYLLEPLPYKADGDRLGEDERDKAADVIHRVVRDASLQGLNVSTIAREDIMKDILKQVLPYVLSEEELRLIPRVLNRKVLIGGSYAFDRQTKRSDVDVYLETPCTLETGNPELQAYVISLTDTFGSKFEVRGVIPEVFSYLQTQGFRLYE